MGKSYRLALYLLISAISVGAADLSALIPAGKYRPFFRELRDTPSKKGASVRAEAVEKEVDVPSFYLDKFPVSNQQFNAFLVLHPEHRKSKVSALFAEPRYLHSWKTDLLSEQDLKARGAQPVTEVSWFIARRYCQAQGKRLPTIVEWEYAGDVTNPEVLSHLLTWYAKTGDQELDSVGNQKPGKFGLYDMHGLIWEWVEDFNSVMISSDSRFKGDRTEGQYCGAGSINAKDAKEYATFMRYGFRSGLRGDYCSRTLGFRCAFDFVKGK